MATKDSDTQVTLSLTGNATDHQDVDDVSNLTVTFDDAAFTTIAAALIVNYERNDLVVDFVDNPAISYDAAAFVEAAANDGSIGNSLVLTLSLDTFTGTNGFGTGRMSSTLTDGRTPKAASHSGKRICRFPRVRVCALEPGLRCSRAPS